MTKKKITYFDIDVTALPASGEVRNFTIDGDIGAGFMLQIVKTLNQSFYNFSTNTFDTAFTPNCNFTHEMRSSRYFGNIKFPSSATTDYQILLLTLNDETEIIQNQKVVDVINKKITQNNDVTITFRTATDNTNTYSSDPAATDVTKAGSPGTAHDAVLIEHTVTNASSDANGFGLFENTTSLQDAILSSGKLGHTLFTEKQVTVDGAVTSGTLIKLDDVSGLAKNAVLKTVSSGSIASYDRDKFQPFITNIDTTANTITMSHAQTLADNITLTFRHYGANAIYSATGLLLVVYPPKLDLVDGSDLLGVSKTVRADGSIADEATDASSAKLALNGTYGIGKTSVKGSTVSGPGITGSIGISAVTTPSSSAGLVTLASAVGPLKVGQTVFFGNGFQRFKPTNQVTIEEYPTSNTIVFVDLDFYITPGEAS